MARLEIDISGDNRKLLASLNDSKAKLTEFQNAVGRLNSNAFSPLTTALNDLKTSFRELSRLAQGLNLNQGNQGGASSLQQARLDAANYRTEIARLNRDLAALRLANAQNRNSNNAAAGSYREAQKRLTDLGNAIRNAAGGFNSTNPAIQAQIRQYRELNDQLKRFDAQMGNHQRNVGNYASGLLGAIPVIGQFTSVVGAVGAAFAGLQNSFNTNLQLDALKTALKNISGDTDSFVKNMEFLRSTSDRLGLEFISTANAFKMWQGAAKFSNLTADESRSIFESVANAGAKMKLSADQVNGTFYALSQMMSKGKVSSEELRQQLGERLPGAVQLMEKALGLTSAELNKMMEQGKILSQDALPKFAAQLDKSFGNDKTEKIESMQASVSRLKNAFTELNESEGATSFYKKVTDGATGVIKVLDKIVNAFDLIDKKLSLGNRTYDYSKNFTKAGFNMFGDNKPADLSMFPTYDTSKLFGVTDSLNNVSEAVIRNKQYWDEQVKSIRGSMEAMDSSMVGSAKYLELQNKLNIAEAQSNAYKAITKTQLNDVKRKQEEYNKAISDVTKGALNQYDQKLFDITDKYNKLYNIIGKTSEKGLLAQQNEQADKLRVNIERVSDLIKGLKLGKVDLKPSDLKNASSINISDALPNVDWNKWGIDNRRGVPTFNDDTTALEKRMGKVIERGLRNGIDGIFGDIDDLGSNFYEVFSNVFGKLSKSVTSMFQSVLATQLGDLLSTKINDKDFSIAGLDAGKSKALIAGIGTAGSLISGLTSKKSVAGQALGGAASGAAAGLAFGPYGAAVGAVIGGLAGMFSAQQANKQSKIQEEMLKEQRKQTALQERANALAYTASIIGQQTTAGIVTGVDRNAFGEITFRVGGRDLVAVLGNEENAQKRGL